jgi:hypothetical protein
MHLESGRDSVHTWLWSQLGCRRLPIDKAVDILLLRGKNTIF